MKDYGKVDKSDSERFTAFTWAPDRKLFKKCVKPIKQLNEHLRILCYLSKCCKQFRVFPELHKSGDLHYHCTLCISDMIKWFRCVLPKFKLHGFCVTKPIDNLADWSKYCKKNIAITEGVLKHQLPYDEHTLTKPKHYLDTDDEKTIDEYIGLESGED